MLVQRTREWTIGKVKEFKKYRSEDKGQDKSEPKMTRREEKRRVA